jgi:hypothetical protein
MSIGAIVVQSWITAIPIAAGLAKLLSQLQDIVDTAYDEMVQEVPNKIASMIKKFQIPTRVADGLCRGMFTPIGEVLQTIYQILPRVDDMVPSDEDNLQKLLLPLIFVILVVSLVFGQVLLLLMMGSTIGGNVEIALGVAICGVIGWMALYVDRIVLTLLGIVQVVANTIIQSLLRKLVPVAKLQECIDLIERCIPMSFLKNKTRRNK